MIIHNLKLGVDTDLKSIWKENFNTRVYYNRPSTYKIKGEDIMGHTFNTYRMDLHKRLITKNTINYERAFLSLISFIKNGIVLEIKENKVKKVIRTIKMKHKTL